MKCGVRRFKILHRSGFRALLSALGWKLHQIAGHPGGVVAGDAGLFQVVSQHRDHAQSLDRIEIGNDLACTFERVLGLRVPQKPAFD